MVRSPLPARRLARLALSAGFAGLAVLIVLAAQALPARTMALPPARQAQPVLVELYQSEGCSSCPPAEAFLNELAGRANVIPLAFEVTYWDRLGWKDRFASPAFTQRQRDFAARSASHEVATPQFWINGTRSVTGANPRGVEAAIAAVRSSAPVPSVGANSVTIAKGAARARPADVWLVRYDPRTIEVPIGAGENAGRTLPHRNLVRGLTRLGQWDGRAVRFAFAPAAQGLRSAVFVQDGRGGAVLSAGTDAR